MPMLANVERLLILHLLIVMEEGEETKSPCGSCPILIGVEEVEEVVLLNNMPIPVTATPPVPLLSLNHSSNRNNKEPRGQGLLL